MIATATKEHPRFQARAESDAALARRKANAVHVDKYRLFRLDDRQWACFRASNPNELFYFTRLDAAAEWLLNRLVGDKSSDSGSRETLERLIASVESFRITIKRGICDGVLQPRND